QTSAMRLLNPADSETTAAVETVSATPAGLDELRAFVRASEIDMRELRSNVNEVLAERGPSTVAEILEVKPATQGVASVVGLLVLAEEYAVRTGSDRHEHVSWTPAEAATPARSATLPQYLFEVALP